MKLNYAIICYKDNEDGSMNIMHTVGYHNMPDENDGRALREELATDEEFGMVGDDYYLMMTLERTKAGDWFDRLGIPEEVGD